VVDVQGPPVTVTGMERRKAPVLEWVLLVLIVAVVVLGVLRVLSPGDEVSPAPQPQVSVQPS
jgi:cytochrome b561